MKNSLDAHFRQRLIKCAESQGVAEAAIRYHISRKTVYKWLKRYDGTLASLEDKSHTVHEHTQKKKLHLYLSGSKSMDGVI